MKFPRNVKLFRGQLDAAPFAGVFFLLIIFLLLNSQLVFVPGVRIHLPETQGAEMPGLTNPYLVVAMDYNGLKYFENQVIGDQELLERLRDAARKTSDLVLVVQADKRVAMNAFYQLSKIANDAGIQEVLLASRPPVTAGKTERLFP